MITDSQVRNISLIKQRLRACLASWNHANVQENKQKFYEYLGIRMRQRRIELGYTQTKVAKITNRTFQQVQKRERATNRIPVDELLMFCEATKTDWSYFFRPLQTLNKKVYMNGRAND